MAQNKYEQFKQYIANFIDGPNADALISTLADDSQKLQNLSRAVTDQLTISTASSVYLDKKLADKGISRPPELGMSDIAFRKMGIQITASKQLSELIHVILETFYGEDTVRANITSTQPAPYNLEDGMELFIELEDGSTRVIPFSATDFININSATAGEVASVITRFIRNQNLGAFAQVFRDLATSEEYVRIFGGAKGPYSTISVVGGEANTRLQFPNIRGTELGVNDTGWEITRTVGSTLRFRWVGNSKPALDLIFPGDRVMIYGSSFKGLSLDGTFIVSNVRPPLAGPDLDAGWFEIENNEFTGLRSTQPGSAPPPNTPPDTFYSYTITQASWFDLMFMRPVKALPNRQVRYALAWEPRGDLLKIYMPATTGIVSRGIIGAAHMHMLYREGNLDGAFGGGYTITSNLSTTSSDITSNDDFLIPAGYGAGQSFKASFGQLQSVVFRLDQDITATGDLVCELWSDNGSGSPLSIIASSAPVPVAPDTSANVSFTFPSGTFLSSGVKYHAIVNVSGATGVFNLKGITLDAFPGGNFVSSSDGSVWVGDLGSDIDFSVSVAKVDFGLNNNIVEVVSDKVVRFRQLGFDNTGNGGFLKWGAGNEIPIDYAKREQYHTTVVCLEPHGLPVLKDQFNRNITLEVVSTEIERYFTDDPINTFKSPYMVDPTVNYTIRSEFVTTRQKVFSGSTLTTIEVDGVLPNRPGNLLFDLNTDTQEGPVRYIGVQVQNAPNVVNIVSISQNGLTLTATTDAPHGAIPGSKILITGTSSFDGTYDVSSVPNPTTIVAQALAPQTANQVGAGQLSVVVENLRSTVLLDPSNRFRFDHPIGSNLTLMSDRNAYQPARDGSDYPFYVTGVAEGRVFAEDVIKAITALGINLEIVIVYPSDKGLGNEGGSDNTDNPPASDKIFVWGV